MTKKEFLDENMTDGEKAIKAAGDEAYEDLISYERLTGTMQ